MALSIPTTADDPNIIITVHYYNPFHFAHRGAEWADDNGRQIFLGEFGAYSAADNCSRVTWTGYIVQQAEARNFIWSYWEFCSGFGVYNSNMSAWRKELLDALIPE